MMKVVVDVFCVYLIFNILLGELGEILIQKKYIYIGIVVDIFGGLVVLVVCDVDKKGIYELFEELMEISKKVCDGKLKVVDM